MRIQYIQPLSRGIARARKELFRPFDLKKWFVVGFTSFLAGLTEMGFFSPPSSWVRRRPKVDIEEVLYFPRHAWEWLGNHPGWVVLIVIALGLLFLLSVFLTWLSSRGKFMFLDNVVRGRGNVVEPWHEYRREGNSFFFWSYGWGLIVLLISLIYFAFLFANFQAIYEGTRDERALLFPVILAGLGFFAISLACAFVYGMLRAFVVPIMYRDRTTVPGAAQKFLPLLSSYFIYFLGYGLLLLGLWIVIGICVVIAGCVTCCVGFVILAIPYIGAVALLPIPYALRAFSVEFLEQFGREFEVFPRTEAPPPITEPATE